MPFFPALLSLSFIVAFSLSTAAQNIEQEILALRTDAQVTRYWKQIRKMDQAHRGLNTIDSSDNLNLKKTILMIRHHGYPKGNMTPNLVLTHQRSAYVREHYFPIFHKAYKAAEADSFWFLHNVRGLHRGRYARDLVQPTASNYMSVLDRLSKWIPAEVSYDISPFDSLFTTYLRDVEHITSTEPVQRWITKETDRITWYLVGDTLYTHKFYWDGSYHMPQVIFHDPVSDRYRYREEIPGRWMEIASDGALLVFRDGIERERLLPDASNLPR